MADAPVMPSLIGGNTNASVMMIGERAADFISAADRLQAPARRANTTRGLQPALLRDPACFSVSETHASVCFYSRNLFGLLSRRIEEFMENLGQSTLRQAAEAARLTAEPNAGLERVLRLAGAPPPRKFSTNARAVVNQLGYGLFPKRGNPSKVITLTIRNVSKRGYLHGQVRPLADWLSIAENKFGCRPGQSGRVEMRIDRKKPNAEKLALRKPLLEILLQ